VGDQGASGLSGLRLVACLAWLAAVNIISGLVLLVATAFCFWALLHLSGVIETDYPERIPAGCCKEEVPVGSVVETGVMMFLGMLLFVGMILGEGNPMKCRSIYLI